MVEDLEDSRFYLQNLLEQKGFITEAAENGKVAFQKFKEGRFDLVITDLKMPGMSGITLLKMIRETNPDIPVIMISAYREINDVVEALRIGACDYIAKPYEEKDLFRSIDRAIRLTDLGRTQKICASYVTSEIRRFEFDNQPEYINSMARFLCRDLALQGMHAEMQSMQVSLIEALNNAIFHGNLEISSDVKDSNDISSFKQYLKIANKRRSLNPYKSRKVTIVYTLNSEKTEYVVRDEGPGFDFKTLPDPLDPESFIKPTGRGILLIQTFCDEVTWNEKGNEITLVKYRDNRGQD